VTSPGQVNGDGKVKDAIVNVLRNEWPLSLREIYFAVVKHYSLRVSHQAVYKALKKLVENKVLIKHERRYCLNIEWIREVKQFGVILEEAYTRPPKEDPQSRMPDFSANSVSTVQLKKTQPSEYKSLEKIVIQGGEIKT
jgi:hypothetical protein